MFLATSLKLISRMVFTLYLRSSNNCAKQSIKYNNSIMTILSLICIIRYIHNMLLWLRPVFCPLSLNLHTGNIVFSGVSLARRCLHFQISILNLNYVLKVHFLISCPIKVIATYSKIKLSKACENLPKSLRYRLGQTLFSS